jgi:hypothetical protein
MRHINGLSFGNLRNLAAAVRKRTVFYFFSLEREIHSIHFSGQALVVRGQR